jgi:hypothetical protein
MAEVSTLPTAPDTGQKAPDSGEQHGALPRSSTVSALPADPSSSASFTPGPLKASLSTPVGGMQCPVRLPILLTIDTCH